jgi:hypothetical protein
MTTTSMLIHLTISRGTRIKVYLEDLKRRGAPTISTENAYPDSVRSQRSMVRELTPGATFAAQFLSQNREQTPALRDVTPNPNIDGLANAEPKLKKKRTRLLLDARTELTDDELKVCTTFTFDLH